MDNQQNPGQKTSKKKPISILGFKVEPFTIGFLIVIVVIVFTLPRAGESLTEPEETPIENIEPETPEVKETAILVEEPEELGPIPFDLSILEGEYSSGDLRLQMVYVEAAASSVSQALDNIEVMKRELEVTLEILEFWHSDITRTLEAGTE